jgi:hypothetical protein
MYKSEPADHPVPVLNAGVEVTEEDTAPVILEITVIGKLGTVDIAGT